MTTQMCKSVGCYNNYKCIVNENCDDNVCVGKYGLL